MQYQNSFGQLQKMLVIIIVQVFSILYMLLKKSFFLITARWLFSREIALPVLFEDYFMRATSPNPYPSL